MAKLLEKQGRYFYLETFRRATWELPYNAITRQLADIIHCNACIINEKQGPSLGLFHALHKTNNDRVRSLFPRQDFPQEPRQEANMVYGTEANLPVTHDWSFPSGNQDGFPDGLTTIAPIHVSGIPLGIADYHNNEGIFGWRFDFGRDCQHCGRQLLEFPARRGWEKNLSVVGQL